MLKVGDILTYHWGYEQTNIDFYRVEEVTPKTVVVVHLSSVRNPDGAMSMTYTAAPDLNGPLGRRFRKKVRDSAGTPVLGMAHGIATPWDGKPQHGSSYA